MGKSTFLSVVTAAKPKIANYEFTTIIPNLGVVKTEYGDSFVIADIPGIIEGASEGVGLGIQFLRHIERTRLLLHFIDVSGNSNRNPKEDFYTINEELRKYSEKLSTRKQIIVANKIDSMNDENVIKELEEIAKKEKMELFKISAATGEGVKELMSYVSKTLKELPKEDLIDGVEDKVIYTLKEDNIGFDIKVEDDMYVITGPSVERLMGRINLNDNESMHYFHKMLEKIGVNDALKKLGVKEGDTVKIVDWELEWSD